MIEIGCRADRAATQEILDEPLKYMSRRAVGRTGLEQLSLLAKVKQVNPRKAHCTLAVGQAFYPNRVILVWVSLPMLDRSKPRFYEAAHGLRARAQRLAGEDETIQNQALRVTTGIDDLGAHPSRARSIWLPGMHRGDLAREQAVDPLRSVYVDHFDGGRQNPVLIQHLPHEQLAETAEVGAYRAPL